MKKPLLLSVVLLLMLSSSFSHLKAMDTSPPMRAAFQNSVTSSLIKNGTTAHSGAIWSPALTLHSSGFITTFSGDLVLEDEQQQVGEGQFYQMVVAVGYEFWPEEAFSPSVFYVETNYPSRVPQSQEDRIPDRTIRIRQKINTWIKQQVTIDYGITGENKSETYVNWTISRRFGLPKTTSFLTPNAALVAKNSQTSPSGLHHLETGLGFSRKEFSITYSHFTELDDKVFTFVAQKTEKMTLGYSHTF